jgi:radical SAM protein with 4Fe4S-binding SPASM domain
VNTSLLKFQIDNIQFLEFELNNQCQYANVHTWCPRNKLGTKPLITLDETVIEQTIRFFRRYDFSGTVYFSIYNEPTLDPRIYDLIRYAKDNLQCTVQMFTNGIDFDENVGLRLFSAGLDILRISIYSEERKKIFTKLAADLQQKVQGQIYLADRLVCSPKDDMGYDDRIDIYDRKLDCNEPCYMPIQYFLINCSGEAMLCWDDWKTSISFGNIYETSIEEILLNPRRLKIIDQLKKGSRLGPCRGCDRPTEMCISEYRDRLKI